MVWNTARCRIPDRMVVGYSTATQQGDCSDRGLPTGWIEALDSVCGVHRELLHIDRLQLGGLVMPNCDASLRFPYSTTLAVRLCWSSQLTLTLSTLLPGRCTPTAGIGDDGADDYDIHIPLSAIPLGVNVGPSLEVLSFAKDIKTGALPWIARRGWLEVGDTIVSLVSDEGEYMSEVMH